MLAQESLAVFILVLFMKKNAMLSFFKNFLVLYCIFTPECIFFCMAYILYTRTFLDN